MTNHLYTRISTDKQDHASQCAQLNACLATLPPGRCEWYRDTASGSTPWKERLLGHIIQTATPGDCILVSEVSRIARSTLGVLSFLQLAQERAVTVIAAKNKLRLDGSLPSKITVTVLALAAEIERDLLRERTTAALLARKQRGLPLGRPVGSRSQSKLDQRKDEIHACLKARVSKRGIARLLAVSPTTLYRYLASATLTPTQENTTP